MARGRKIMLRAVLFAVLIFAAMLVLFGVLYRTDNKYTAGPPYGKDGVFPISERDLDENRPLFLIDGWEFYPDKLYTPADFADGRVVGKQMVFIGQYPNFSFAEEGHSPFGAATYRLTLRYEGTPRTLMLELPEIFTDYTLWADGTPIAQTGSGPTALVPVQGGTELVLQVQNQSHYYSGMTYPPALGTAGAIGRMFLIRNLFYGGLCVFAFTLCLFAGASWLARERDGRFVHFGLLCLFFAVHCLHPFVHQLGGSGLWWYAVEDVSFLAMLYEAAVLCAAEAGFGQARWFRRVVRPLAVTLCLLCAAMVTFIIPAAGGIINLYGAFVDGLRLLFWLFLCGCAVYGLRSGRTGGWFILAGGSVLGASLLVNRMDNNYFEPIYTGWQTEYAGLLLVLIFWLMTLWRIRVLLVQNARLTHHLEETVAQRTKELSAVLLERKAFFSDMAHNLKAPVAAIHSFIRLILQGNHSLDGELRGYLEQIGSENREMQQRMQVFGDLNAFDKITEPSEYVEWNSLLAQVERENGPEALVSGVYFTVGRLERPAHVFGQRRKLLLLFENLIYNAIGFTPEEGRITISPAFEDGRVAVRVTDTGSGIAPEHLPHLFERFYSVRENPSDGSGLGLYITRITAEELGGSISAESEPGKGSTFTLRVPLSREPEKELPEA